MDSPMKGRLPMKAAENDEDKDNVVSTNYTPNKSLSSSSVSEPSPAITPSPRGIYSFGSSVTRGAIPYGNVDFPNWVTPPSSWLSSSTNYPQNKRLPPSYVAGPSPVITPPSRGSPYRRSSSFGSSLTRGEIPRGNVVSPNRVTSPQTTDFSAMPDTTQRANGPFESRYSTIRGTSRRSSPLMGNQQGFHGSFTERGSPRHSITSVPTKGKPNDILSYSPRSISQPTTGPFLRETRSSVLRSDYQRQISYPSTTLYVQQDGESLSKGAYYQSRKPQTRTRSGMNTPLLYYQQRQARNPSTRRPIPFRQNYFPAGHVGSNLPAEGTNSRQRSLDYSRRLKQYPSRTPVNRSPSRTPSPVVAERINSRQRSLDYSRSLRQRGANRRTYVRQRSLDNSWSPRQYGATRRTNSRQRSLDNSSSPRQYGTNRSPGRTPSPRGANIPAEKTISQQGSLDYSRSLKQYGSSRSPSRTPSPRAYTSRVGDYSTMRKTPSGGGNSPMMRAKTNRGGGNSPMRTRLHRNAISDDVSGNNHVLTNSQIYDNSKQKLETLINLIQSITSPF